MILVITHKNDYTADFVINKFNERKISYRRFNCEDILSNPLTLSFDDHLHYSILGETAYKSVWFRRTMLPDIIGLNDHDRHYILNETDSFIKNLLSIIDAEWLSTPSAVYQAENKLLQLKTAAALGFTIPPTLVTNSKEELLRFYDTNDQDIIIKPISQTRIVESNNASFIFTNKIPALLMSQIDEYDLTPCIYQKNIRKDYELRITVVGNKVFATSIDSQSDSETSIDWRRKRLEFTPCSLPLQVEDLCRGIVKSLGLRFGAIDLIKTQEGEYIFLEINPNGQWAWIEIETCLPISDAIIELLNK